MDLEPILVVEDSPEDFEATSRQFRKAGLANPLVLCTDGDTALDYLRHQGAYKDPNRSRRPGLVLLDLHLPGTDGREVLSVIKNAPELKTIPVIVLATSADERDIERCYADGANGHVPKPVDVSGLVKALEEMQDCRFALTLVPPEEE
jgi:CheY-like chemotaxis protein